MANGEEAIARAIREGDAAGALTAYTEYADSMIAAGQTPKSPRDFGIK